MAKTPMTCTPVKKATKAKIVAIAEAHPTEVSLTSMMDIIVDDYIAHNNLVLDVKAVADPAPAAVVAPEEVVADAEATVTEEEVVDAEEVIA